MKKENSLAMTLRIEQIIRTVRGQRVILDSDLAAIYGVSTKALNMHSERILRCLPSRSDTGGQRG